MYYISGYIVRKLQNTIDCYNCLINLIQTAEEHNYASCGSFAKFTIHSNNGGLIYPSRSVYKTTYLL